MARQHAGTLLGALAVLMLAGCAPTRDDAPGHFVGRALTLDGHTTHYQVFVPRGARARPGAVPVVLFLHGSGERGRDGLRQIQAGLGPYLRAHARDFPALVVLPQVPDDEEWSGQNNRLALAALDTAIAEFGGDRQRQYLTGMSMGGYGSWNIALAEPTRFAAMVPVCGAVLSPHQIRPDLQVEAVAGQHDPYASIAQRLHALPIWMFHGALDDIVPPGDDRKLYAALQQAGALDVRYTEYPQGNHNAWDATYADPAMWAWLFAQKRH